MDYAWHLPKILKEKQITPYRLRQTLVSNGNKITMKTVYRWSKELPDLVNVNYLMAIINALRELTGEDIRVNDLLEYIPDTSQEA